MSGPSGLRAWWRRRRTGVLLALVALVAVVVAVVTSGSQGTAAPLDPDNPSSDGARAVARVLADQGVEVDVVRSAGALERAAPGGDDTVLVTGTEALGRSTAERLLAATRGSTLVVAEPGPAAARLLDLPSPTYRLLPRPVVARCDDPTYAGLRLQVDEASAYRLPGGCFGGPGGSLVGAARDGIVVLGAGQALTNDQVVRADDAAVALRLLGAHPRLVWYVPDPAEVGATDGVTVASLLPAWLGPVLLLALLVALAALLWRGRRLGPLVSEPLPVVVKAVETTQSRGRLYRRAGDRAHAAGALRRGSLRRVAGRLGTSERDVDGTVAAAAARLGRSPGDVAAVLSPAAPAPADDRALVALAGDLTALEAALTDPGHDDRPSTHPPEAGPR